MKKVLLDTNFCMIPFQFKIDIYSEIRRIMDSKYKLCVLDKTIDELKELVKKGKGKHRDHAKLALLLLKKKKIKIIKTKLDNYVDDLIVGLVDGDYIVCTQDIGLKRKLENKGIKIIMMRQRKYLIIV